jgi:hypothetical protein
MTIPLLKEMTVPGMEEMIKVPRGLKMTIKAKIVTVQARAAS